MYNLRYHIVSIVAVFLALALGLVLGGLIGDKATTTSQNTLVGNIMEQFRSNREESARVNDENDRLSTFGNDALTEMISGRLDGKTVLVIGADGDASKHVTELLQKAGAVPLVADINADAYKSSDKNQASAKLVGGLKSQYKQDDDLSALAAGFAAEWSHLSTPTATGKPSAAQHPVTAALQSDGILKISGDLTGAVRLEGVVDVAQADKGTADNFGLTLAQAFQKQNVAVVAAQENDASILAPSAADQNLCATNLLATPLGDWTVVAVLNGAEPAPYGTFSGADSLYPPIK